MMTEEQVLALGYDHARQLADGTWLAVSRMTYNKGRLFYNLDYCGFEACYCYTSVPEALAAMEAFDPEKDEEPQGWFRDPRTGRRRPGGDKSLETLDREDY